MGRPQFAQAGTFGGGQTVATTNRPELKAANLDQSTTVGSGDQENIEVYAPTGSIYRVVGMLIDIDGISGATSYHRCELKSVGNSTILKGRSGATDPVEFFGSTWQSATNVAQPGTGDCSGAVRCLRATESSPLTVFYYNGTDSSQSNSRRYRLTFEEESY